MGRCLCQALLPNWTAQRKPTRGGRMTSIVPYWNHRSWEDTSWRWAIASSSVSTEVIDHVNILHYSFCCALGREVSSKALMQLVGEKTVQKTLTVNWNVFGSSVLPGSLQINRNKDCWWYGTLTWWFIFWNTRYCVGVLPKAQQYYDERCE